MVSNDGEILFSQCATGIFNGRHRFEVWAVKGGRLLFSNHPKEGPNFAKGRDLRAYGADLSPDGHLLALTGIGAWDVALYNLETGQFSALTVAEKQLRGVIEVRFLPDSKHLQCQSLGAPGRYDERLFILGVDGEVKSQHVLGKEFMIEGTAAGKATVTEEKGEGGRVFTDWESGKTVLTIGPKEADSLTDLEFFCEGHRLVATTDRSIRVWNVDDGTASDLDKRDAVTHFTLATNRFILAASSGDNVVNIWDFTGSKPKQ